MLLPCWVSATSFGDMPGGLLAPVLQDRDDAALVLALQVLVGSSTTRRSPSASRCAAEDIHPGHAEYRRCRRAGPRSSTTS